MKAKTRQQLAVEYGICTKTLNKWLKRTQLEVPRGLIPPKTQSKIYNKLGIPRR